MAMWRGTALCRSSLLGGLPELIVSLGGNPKILFEESGLTLEDHKRTEKFVPWLAFNRLLCQASDRLGAPDFGLRWSIFQKPGLNNYGPIAALLIVSPDVRTFLNMWIEYDKIHTSGSYTEIIEDKERGSVRAVVHYSPTARDSRQMKEACLSFFHRLYNDSIGSPEFAPTQVGFPHRAMSKPEIYENYFDCPVEFSAHSTYIEFPNALLNKKLGPSFKLGRKVFDYHSAARLKTSPTSQISFTDHVALILPNILGLGKSNVNQVAETLDLSVRKLQRLLKDEGTSYSAILDEVRHDMAIQFLRDSDISISNIATLLDYASDVPFCTAFNRWTNMSPSAYRNAHNIQGA